MLERRFGLGGFEAGMSAPLPRRRNFTVPRKIDFARGSRGELTDASDACKVAAAALLLAAGHQFEARDALLTLIAGALAQDSGVRSHPVQSQSTIAFGKPGADQGRRFVRPSDPTTPS
jgi:hypothetical protein